MAGPLLQLGQHLPAAYGSALPFDKSPLDYHPGSTRVSQTGWLLALIEDIVRDEERLRGYLPAAYLRAQETKRELATGLGF